MYNFDYLRYWRNTKFGIEDSIFCSIIAVKASRVSLKLVKSIFGSPKSSCGQGRSGQIKLARRAQFDTSIHSRRSSDSFWSKKKRKKRRALCTASWPPEVLSSLQKFKLKVKPWFRNWSYRNRTGEAADGQRTPGVWERPSRGILLPVFGNKTTKRRGSGQVREAGPERLVQLCVGTENVWLHYRALVQSQHQG